MMRLMAGKKATPKKVTKKKIAKKRSGSHAKEFLAASTRAKKLYGRVVKNGYAIKTPGGAPKPLSKPDRWDMTEHMFFEIAAKFEQFAKRTLVLEVQKTLGVNRTRAEHMVGSSEGGIPSGMGGWAHVSKMRKRAQGLLGKSSAYAQVEQLLGTPKARYLGMAVTIRNRIAHGKGNNNFTTMLGNTPVSLNARQRKGVSPGMLLAEYPKTAADNDKWFFRLLDAYESWVAIVKRKV